MLNEDLKPMEICKYFWLIKRLIEILPVGLILTKSFEHCSSPTCEAKRSFINTKAKHIENTSMVLRMFNN